MSFGTVRSSRLRHNDDDTSSDEDEVTSQKIGIKPPSIPFFSDSDHCIVDIEQVEKHTDNDSGIYNSSKATTSIGSYSDHDDSEGDDRGCFDYFPTQPSGSVKISQPCKPSFGYNLEYDEAHEVESDKNSQNDIESPRSDNSFGKDSDTDVYRGVHMEGTEMKTFRIQNNETDDFQTDDDSDSDEDVGINPYQRLYRGRTSNYYTPMQLESTEDYNGYSYGQSTFSFDSSKKALQDRSASSLRGVDESVNFPIYSRYQKYNRTDYGSTSSDSVHVEKSVFSRDRPPFGHGTDQLNKVGSSIDSLIFRNQSASNMPEGHHISSLDLASDIDSKKKKKKRNSKDQKQMADQYNDTPHSGSWTERSGKPMIRVNLSTDRNEGGEIRKFSKQCVPYALDKSVAEMWESGSWFKYNLEKFESIFKKWKTTFICDWTEFVSIEERIKNWVQNEDDYFVGAKIELLQDLTHAHVDSFNYMLQEGLSRSVQGIPPGEFVLPNGDHSVSFSVLCMERGVSFRGGISIQLLWKINVAIQVKERLLGDVSIMVKVLGNRFDEYKRKVDTGQERFHKCEKIAKRLKDDKTPYEEQVEERQAQIREISNERLEKFDGRNQKIYGAQEIHRFNRDIEEALARILEKSASIPDDLARDLVGTQLYLKKHEAFGNELALEAQDRDLIGLANENEHEMLVKVKVKDVHSVDRRKTRQEEPKAEMKARDDTVDTIAKTGEAMIQNNHYAKEEARLYDVCGLVVKITLGCIIPAVLKVNLVVFLFMMPVLTGIDCSESTSETNCKLNIHPGRGILMDFNWTRSSVVVFNLKSERLQEMDTGAIVIFNRSYSACDKILSRCSRIAQHCSNSAEISGKLTGDILSVKIQNKTLVNGGILCYLEGNFSDCVHVDLNSSCMESASCQSPDRDGSMFGLGKCIGIFVAIVLVLVLLNVVVLLVCIYWRRNQKKKCKYKLTARAEAV